MYDYLRRKKKTMTVAVLAVMGCYPSIFLPYAILARQFTRKPKGQVITKDTDIVIEGFPRSANSFSVKAFKDSQSENVVVAHHLHAPAQVIEAAKRGIPAYVLIRSPYDAIASRTIFAERADLAQIMKNYWIFYSKLLPLADSFVIGLFENIIQDFGVEIRKINQRFGTTFAEFNHTQENVDKCMAGIEEFSELEHGVKRERRIPRPSDWRVQEKKRLNDIYFSDKLSGLRKQVENIYEDYLQIAKQN